MEPYTPTPAEQDEFSAWCAEQEDALSQTGQDIPPYWFEQE